MVVLVLLKKVFGRGRVVIATMAVCIAAVTLSGCSAGDLDPNKSPDRKAYQTELTTRGFTKVTAGNFVNGDGYVYYIGAGKCRGTAYAWKGDISVTFTGSDIKSYAFTNPTVSLVLQDKHLAYCAKR